MTQAQRIVLASRPVGEPKPDNFRLENIPLPVRGPGQMLLRTVWLSLDPYMRGRMDEGRSYTANQALDQVMGGGAAGEVVESNDPNFKPGDKVVGPGGWQLYATGEGKFWRKVDASKVPLQAFLGATGMPGVTAWIGLNRIIHPKAGQTIVCSAATGAGFWDA